MCLINAAHEHFVTQTGKKSKTALKRFYVSGGPRAEGPKKQIPKILNDFNTLILKQIFWKRKTFFKKPEYNFLVKSTKIENASFPYKTTISEANVKTNRMVSTKWTYHKERVLPITNLFL